MLEIPAAVRAKTEVAVLKFEAHRASDWKKKATIAVKTAMKDVAVNNCTMSQTQVVKNIGTERRKYSINSCPCGVNVEPLRVF